MKSEGPLEVYFMEIHFKSSLNLSHIKVSWAEQCSQAERGLGFSFPGCSHSLHDLDADLDI
jgi:hypothetical protein